MIPDEVRTTAAGYANVGKPTEAIRPIGMREQVDMTLKELDVAIAKVENIMGSLGVPIHPRDCNENAEDLSFKLYQLATGVNTLSQYASMIQEVI